jgi:hypothetical protein
MPRVAKLSLATAATVGVALFAVAPLASADQLSDGLDAGKAQLINGVQGGEQQFLSGMGIDHVYAAKGLVNLDK